MTGDTYYSPENSRHIRSEEKKILQPEGMHMVKQHSALFSQDTKADDTKSTKGG